jgi:hypothetical protein
MRWLLDEVLGCIREIFNLNDRFRGKNRTAVSGRQPPRQRRLFTLQNPCTAIHVTRRLPRRWPDGLLQCLDPYPESGRAEVQAILKIKTWVWSAVVIGQQRQHVDEGAMRPRSLMPMESTMAPARSSER